ncbi:hypothetical protein FEK35_11330 [Nocardia cyriacigeorgica]|uniref:WXG100 family type VII secretion target n=1 Tax=Nocardia cyriacigeorgica TaxID=135487 RepID=A0A5R8PEJ5_9NOCA|nr:hypothetical protein [Nocardia cyriacigeorgica]TLG12113.1 hypothetical protein FEK35_11330 [Nocardia cyriacigeorgica]
MSQPLRIDPARVDTLIPQLNALARSAREQFTTLKTGLAGHGRPWGSDEAGKTFAEGYEPRAEKSLEALENLAARLAEASRQIRDATNQLYDTDLSGAREIQAADPGYLDWSGFPQGPGVSGPQASGWGPNVPGASELPGMSPDGTADAGDGGGTEVNRTADSTAPSDVSADQPVDYASDGPESSPGAADPASSPQVSPGPGGSPYPGRSDTQADGPGSSIRPEATPGSTPAQLRGPQQNETPAPPWAPAPAPGSSSPAGPAAPAAGTNGAAKPTDSGARPAGGRTAETPWTRPQPGTPWGPGAPRSRPPGAGPVMPGQAIPPRRPGREPVPATPTRGKPDKKRSPKKRPEQPVSGPATTTDAAALAAAQALAARHDLQLTGFDNSGIAEHTVLELAAAVDDTLAKYPFLRLGGIEITALAGGAVTAVHWDRADDGPWISIDRKLAANPDKFDGAVKAALRAGRIPQGSDQRPIYATMVHAIGRVLVAAAGPRAQQLAQRSLITEYRRISGPWDGVTLAGVVAGYRGWRAELSPNGFRRNQFHPQTALETAFTEVELRGADASGPAKALHRLVVELARGRPG